MEEALSDQKIFSLQLQLQNLTEELALYRNGTTGATFTEIIKEKEYDLVELRRVCQEKEKEFTTLKQVLTDKNETLRKLAKGSTELLAKCDGLQQEKSVMLKDRGAMETQIFELNENIKAQKTLFEQRCSVLEMQIVDVEEKKQLQNDSFELQIAELDEKNKELGGELNGSRQRVAELEGSVSRLEEDLMDRDESIGKLQQRCAGLVSEKTDKTRALDKERADRAKQAKEFNDEMEKAMKFNIEIKDRVKKEQTHVAEAKKVALVQAQESEQSLAISRRETADVKTQLSTLTSTFAQVAGLAAEVEETLQLKLAQQNILMNDKEARISELTGRLTRCAAELLANSESIEEKEKAVLSLRAHVSHLETQARVQVQGIREVSGTGQVHTQARRHDDTHTHTHA